MTYYDDIEQCGRCGSTAVADPCEFCPATGWYDRPDPDCPACDGTGFVWRCLSSEEYCQSNPLPGREDWERHVVEFISIPSERDQSEEGQVTP